jgi:hypothetical protein
VFAFIAPPSNSPTAAVGDPRELLHINMNQLARPVALITANRCRCGPITAIETTNPMGVENSLNGRSSNTNFMADVVCSPTTLCSQLDDLSA